jgi:hypothetical protein
VYAFTLLRNDQIDFEWKTFKASKWINNIPFRFQALSDISDGETDDKVLEIETLDFEGSNREQLLCRIQQKLHKIENEMQFHHNLKGKIHALKE